LQPPWIALAGVVPPHAYCTGSPGGAAAPHPTSAASHRCNLWPPAAHTDPLEQPSAGDPATTPSFPEPQAGGVPPQQCVNSRPPCPAPRSWATCRSGWPPRRSWDEWTPPSQLIRPGPPVEPGLNERGARRPPAPLIEQAACHGQDHIGAHTHSVQPAAHTPTLEGIEAGTRAHRHPG